MMNHEDAEEYTQSLGQIIAGSWRQIAWAQRQGIPKALGLTTEEWVQQRLGGYVKMSIPERREAVKELTEDGHSTREVGEILGVSHVTAASDVKELTPEVAEPELALSAPWTPEQTERKEAADGGQCVVANMRDGADEALIAWAQEANRFVRIDRTTAWGNPFEMPDDGDREQVINKFAEYYFPHKDSLLSKLETLRGKVLGCWCHPEECHGHFIAEVVNRKRQWLSPVLELIDQMIDERHASYQ